MRVVVIGGNGFLGSRAVRALRRAPRVEVISASRRPGTGGLTVDLRNPNTFAVLAGADVVVDVSSSHDAAPDALAAYCLEHGLILIETSSDRVVIERLLAKYGERGPATQAGALVLGGGLFTGLSNAIAREVVRDHAGAERVELAVSSSPFSGAGAGTVDLMVDALATPARRFVAGRAIDAPAVSRGPTLSFPSGQRATLEVPLAEPAMIHASLGVPTVSAYLAPEPPFLVAAFIAMPEWLLQSPLYRGFLRVYFTLLRRVLLRARPTRVELLARASSAGRATTEIRVATPDGFEAAGVLIAATALELAEKKPRGCITVDAVVSMDAMLERVRTLVPEQQLEVWRATATKHTRLAS